MDRIRLRPARQEDAAALQRLNADVLGYDYSLSDTQEQLHRLLAMPQHLIVVAEAEGKQELVGYVHAQDYEVLYSSPMKDILGIEVIEHIAVTYITAKWNKFNLFIINDFLLLILMQIYF